MRAVVTRPQPEAARWAQALRARGIDAIELPLIEIAPAPDPDAVRAAWARLGEFAALMFVSGNAVRHFFAHADAGSFSGQAWAPGPGTRDALLAAGVPAQRVRMPDEASAKFDSEGLWACVQGEVRAGDRVLLVRGGGPDGRAAGRDWLADRLIEAGASAESLVVYVRRPPTWDASAQAAAGAATRDGSIWLFSSSEAIAHLRQAAPGLDVSRTRALATHPRIAQAAQSAGFGQVLLAAPTLEAVAASIESAG